MLRYLISDGLKRIDAVELNSSYRIRGVYVKSFDRVKGVKDKCSDKLMNTGEVGVNFPAVDWRG
jgi:hypothetical protein